MPVSAHPAKSSIGPANLAPDVGMVDMRAPTRVRAGTFVYEGDDLVTGWHTHDLHQVEYAFRGIVEVETQTARYLLPPHQAIWVPAGLPHCTTLREVRTVSVFFDPEMVESETDRARVLAAAPVIREMIVYAARWPITRETSDSVADAFFEALALLTRDWLDHEQPLSLPVVREPVAAAAIAYTDDHLRDVTERDVCVAVGVSERTLRRYFVAATGSTWRQYVVQARLLHTMALLAERGSTVLDAATAAGFTSASAFGRAFVRFTGETPSAYRARCREPQPGIRD